VFQLNSYFAISMADKKLKEYLDQFIKTVPEYLSKIKVIAGINKLNYNLGEIRELEKLYRESVWGQFEYSFLESKLPDHLAELELIFTAYIGVTWMVHFGGEWEINGYKKDPRYGMIIITAYGPPGYESFDIAPQDWLRQLSSEQNELIPAVFETYIRTFKKKGLQLTPIKPPVY
jgi:hypothetical protein